MLSRAMTAWESWEGFRRERSRNKRFTFGDQWCDPVRDGDETISEEEWIRRQGCEPLKNNMIRRLVRSVVGVFRQNYTVPRVTARDPEEKELATLMNRLLDMNSTLNCLPEMFARTLEEFLVSGVAVHRKWYGPRNGVCECRTDYVHPERFFAEMAQGDLLGRDMDFLGEIHDFSPAELYSRFGRTPDDCRLLNRLFGAASASATEHCRVVEVWDCFYSPRWLIHDIDAARIRLSPDAPLPESAGRALMRMTRRWRYSYLAPDGTVLRRGFTPYAHGSHPFVMKGYPMLDGEIHSFVADIIDQQKYTNRLITLYDWTMRASAKGVLLIPRGSVPPGSSVREMADQWGRFNGVIEYRPSNDGARPEQVSANATNVGITDLLEIQLKMFEDISGVSSALQGKLENSSMSGTLFDQQTRNALAALLDLTEAFRSFIIDGAVKDASNLLQFYTPADIEAAAGKGASRLQIPTERYGRLLRDFRFN